jgi:transcriptional regulator with XRE-family HTH domain
MTLAEQAQLNHKHIGNIELGKVDAGADALIRLARALAVPVGELFETITPADAPAYRVLSADLEEIRASLGTVTAILDRLRARQPRPVGARARRRRSPT